VSADLLALAFGAGLVAAVNPCGFVMLPAYLALVVQGEATGTLAAVGRAAAATAAMAAGFVLVFGSFGLLTVSAATTVQRYLPVATVVVGAGLVALGFWLLIGRELTGLTSVTRRVERAPTARIGSMFGYGVSYAVASLSCTVAPFLAVTGAGLRGQSLWSTLSIYLAYAAGFTLIVGVLAMAAALTHSALAVRLRRIGRYVNRISGVLLVAVGGYVAYYGLYELRLFWGGANPQDPVIEAAARAQGAIAGWVHRHGGGPWLAATAVLMLVVLATGFVARIRRSARR
jgi:cytochrome c biogenesis protein CcdA